MDIDADFLAAGRGHPTATYRTRVALDPPLPEAYSAELTARVFFVSAAIVDFSLIRSDGAIHAVDLVVRESGESEGNPLGDLARKLRFVVANDVLPQRRVEPKVIWRGPTAAPEPHDVFGEMLERGIAAAAGEGQVALGEPVLTLMDYLDGCIRDLTMDGFGAREFRYPTIIPTATMERCGYFRSFPQLMMFVTRLHSDVDAYRGFLDDLAAGHSVSSGVRSHGDDFEYCLPPTMCFHTYHQFADRPLPERSLAITARGKSFRFESRYRRSLERLWDFTIREVVFLGSRDSVLARRRQLMDLTFALVERLGLSGHCEVASDPFFVSSDTAERVWSQQLLELKYELRLPLEPGRDVAVGSFNFHDQFFGASFGIRVPGDPCVDRGDAPAVHTACAGFGLERLAYAFLCQHGLDPAGWPGEVREVVAR